MDLDIEKLRHIINGALAEDIGDGDVTTNLIIPPSQFGKGVFISKEDGVLAGIDVAQLVFEGVDRDVTFKKYLKDGDKLTPKVSIAEVEGRVKSFLTAERVALNFLQRLSSIATLTAKFVEKVKGTKAKIIDTRKTTPSLRNLEKYAVRVGGGENHRFGLYDMILIKDNHIEAAGGIVEAINRVKKGNKKRLKIEVETQSLKEVEDALNCGVDRIMLDNMSVKDIRKAVELIKGNIELEVSGGVNLNNVSSIASTGIDYISVGSLTHSAKSIDISFEIMI